MKKFIFELLTSPLSLFENAFYNYIVMAIIGYIAYKIAFYIIGRLNLNGEVGSISHWIVRFFVFVFIWIICCFIIGLVEYIINNWIIVMVCIILLITLFFLKIYSNKNSESVLNKKLF